ncbi:kinase with adenine nucleotide alpha hydrolases-like domain-containing protein [Actinidia rufa]|uniref:RING-type E3 ubiquitin transferase n=1 Tax=Actinidia rufa TaxID=165716 RepID=A0A7J0FRA1_9ERIC|nr:kinase with adenine nucleotide alpha hydrolases-like domain-containing protein [Actinidia rufa]
MAHHPSSDSDGLSLPTAVAIDRDKHSPYAVRWAIENLLPPNANLLLIHITNRNSQQRSSWPSFKMRGYADISGVTDSTLDANGGPTEPDLQNVFGSFRLYCARKGVTPKEAVLDDTDISKALLNFISNNFVANIVLGAATRRKALSIRPALRPALNSATPPRLPSPRGLPPQLPHDPSDLESAVKAQFIMGGHDTVKTRTFPTNMSMDMDMFSRGTKPTSSRTSLADDCDFPTPHNTGSIDMTAQNLDFNPPPGNKPSIILNVEAEMKRLKLELKQTMDMYNTACKEAVSAKKKAKELHQWKKEEAHRFEQARLAEEAAFAIVEKEKARSKAALEAAEKAQKLAEMEAQRRQFAELKARRETKEKNRALDVLSQNDVRYRKYTIEEIETATDHFSGSLKIGEGGYGPVYRGKLDHTPVAIKVLRPDAKQGRKQFQQEVEILSCIRHPNMVLLLGACPEYGCLVYEFMNYGSLEDRLFRKGNSPPIPWRIRFKIAADIAIGLLFLHQAKPEPLVHRDLKPANILLDRNFVCKISDVGLARLVPPSVADSGTQYHMTSAAGTFCYIDPEYQQTGKLGTKSDIYSLGIMLLQIITARPPMGLTHHVERAIQKGTFADLLDPTVPDWPVEEALQFANLSLKCCELRKKDRPDLGLIILPELNRLRDFGKSKK